MATGQELAELFGPGGIVVLDEADSLANGVPADAAEVLAEVGLPAYLDVLFTNDIGAEPAEFSIVPVDAGDERVAVLVLGRPTDDQGMRYALDLRNGCVILLSLGEEPAAEVVNTTLADFVEFLYRVALRLTETEHASDEQRAAYDRRLRAHLRDRDPLAFAQPDTWWSMIFDHLV
ncbi:SUKH-4 family immunity protein [Kitasatospora sp. NPDC050543]|uniref:SUKH-4 family immunity protein n=1 Tax=Kitasatospora sp. NPDC050543 TaxID=3364054 RepID=UPI0037BD5F37